MTDSLPMEAICRCGHESVQHSLESLSIRRCLVSGCQCGRFEWVEDMWKKDLGPYGASISQESALPAFSPGETFTSKVNVAPEVVDAIMRELLKQRKDGRLPDGPISQLPQTSAVWAPTFKRRGLGVGDRPLEIYFECSKCGAMINDGEYPGLWKKHSQWHEQMDVDLQAAQLKIAELVGYVNELLGKKREQRQPRFLKKESNDAG